MTKIDKNNRQPDKFQEYLENLKESYVTLSKAASDSETFDSCGKFVGLLNNVIEAYKYYK